MSHQTWGLERCPEKGVRSTVKLWPTGEHKRGGMRYRMLRGEWHKSGSEQRDLYQSKMGLQRRVAELEATFLLGLGGPQDRTKGAGNVGRTLAV